LSIIVAVISTKGDDRSVRLGNAKPPILNDPVVVLCPPVLPGKPVRKLIVLVSMLITLGS
jgi:hypothetical protein